MATKTRKYKQDGKNYETYTLHIFVIAKQVFTAIIG